MSSGTLGIGTLGAEVSGISRQGVWLLVQEREYFLPFEDFPWFEASPVHAVLRVELVSPHHLYWPELDVDLHVDSLEHPEHFPLVSKSPPPPIPVV